ncbi:MAG: SIR2 family protein [Chloroflexota bacterium]|nr:SIR2 family protein [Chloroflexota bacterium]
MRNPYIFGNWVSGKNLYGREAIIDEILHGPYNALYVMGNRRVGKTSLLRHVETLAPSIFLDFQKIGGDPTGLARELRREIRRKSHKLDFPAIELLDGKDAFEILEALDEEAEKRQIKLILLCDEAEVLLEIGHRDPQALRRLRAVLQGSRALSTVLTATKELCQLNDLCRRWHTSPFLHGFSPRYLSGLTDGAAEDLIRQTHLETQVSVSPSTVKEIRGKTNNHPYLLQRLCHKLWQEDGSLRQIEKDDLIVDELLASFFQIDFDHLSPREREILLQISEGGEVDEASLQAGTSLPSSDLKALLYSLTELGYIKKVNERFSVGNHFFAQWLSDNRERLRKKAAGEVSDAAMHEVAQEAISTSRVKSLANLMRLRKASGEFPCVLILGAGASLSSGCSSGRKLVEDVVAKLSAKDVTSLPWDERLTEFYRLLDNLSETERYLILKGHLEGKMPSVGYRCLAKLVKEGYFDVMLSTNLDVFVEDALSDAGLRAKDFTVLINGKDTEDQIRRVLGHREPRVKIVKLHGDLPARVFAFTPDEVFEFGEKLENLLEEQLSKDMIIVGHSMRDDDVNRCIRRQGGSIWYVNPSKPKATQFIGRAMQVRTSNAITGELGKFDNFFQALYNELVNAHQ